MTGIAWALAATAWASPATDRLARAVAAMPADSPHWSGDLHHQGHGPVPGHTQVHPVQVTVEQRGGQTQGRWQGDGWSEALVLGPDGPLHHTGQSWEPGSDAAVLQWLATAPSALLVHLSERPARLRDVDGGVLWASSEGLATLSFDATGRPVALTLPRAHPVFGDVVDSVRWTWSPTPTVRIERTDADTRFIAQFTPSTAGESIGAEAWPEPAEYPVEDLGGGLQALAVPAADSRALLFIDGEHGVLFDAPLSSDIGDRLLRQAQRLGPEVTEWSVVVSHHHPHYVGGLRPWARAGATVYAPAAIAPWLSESLGTDRALAPGDPGVDVTVVPVSSDRSLLDGAVQLRPVDDASGHTEAFVMAFLPASRTLYVADLAAWTEGAEGPRHRGQWPAAVADWKPERVVPSFPLEGARSAWPFSDLSP